MSSFSEYSNDEVERLVKSLDRKEDEFIFSKDVLLTHPHLAEVYTLTCPERCDLATAARKAASGQYSGDRNLSKLRADLQLMVDNCIRFNGESSPLASIAKKFFAFSTQRINGFIEQHFPSSPGFTSFSFAGVRTTDPKIGQVSASSLSSSTNLSYSLPPPRRKEIEELLLPLRQQNAEFAIDVTVAYPELKEKYVAICPRVMHLGLMIEKARAGVYSGDTEDPLSSTSSTRGRMGRGKSGSHNRGSFGGDSAVQLPVWGTTIASSLLLLRQDIELIVHNCVVFNANLEKWVRRARQFQRHAHRLIDSFVVKHCPMLKGTVTGEIQYAAAVQGDGEEKKKRGLEKMNPSTSSSMQESVPWIASSSTSSASLDSASLTEGLGGKQTRQEGTTPTEGLASSTVSDFASTSTSSLSFASSAGIRKKTVQWEEEYSSAPLGGDVAVSSTAGVHTGRDPLGASASTASSPVKGLQPRVVHIEEEEGMEDGLSGTSFSGKERQWVFPTPLPSVAQPPLAVPSRLRQRLVKDHLSRHALRPRIIGQVMEDESVCRIQREGSKRERGDETNRGGSEESHSCKRMSLLEDKAGSGEREMHLSNGTGKELPGGVISNATDARHEEGESMPHTVVIAPPHPTTDALEEKMRNAKEDNDEEGKKRLARNNSLVDKNKKKENDERGGILLTTAHSAAALLTAFETHICHIFARQRLDSSAVENAFRYTRQEEQVIVDIIHTIGEQFNRLFLSLLVYASEMVAFRAYAATQRILPWVLLASPQEGNPPQDGGTDFSFTPSDSTALAQSGASSPFTVLHPSRALPSPISSSLAEISKPTSSMTNHDGNLMGVQTSHSASTAVCHRSSHSASTPMDWLHCAHYSYLIRLVVQFPQIVALSCCVDKREISHEKGVAANTFVTLEGEGSGVKTEEQSIPAREGAKIAYHERNDASTLLFPRSAKGLLAHVRQVAEDLLAFADEYECLLLEN